MARITNDYQTRFTNAETSWRRESVWEYEIMFEGGLEERDEQEKQRAAKTAAVSLPLWQRYGSGMAAVGNRCHFPAAVRQRFNHRGTRCVKRCESAVTSAAVNMVWRVDHGFLSGQVQHGLGSRWPTAT